MNPFNKTFEKDAIPKRKTVMPTTAVRVAAHSETASNDLKPVNASKTKPNFGAIGLKGNGQQS